MLIMHRKLLDIINNRKIGESKLYEGMDYLRYHNSSPVKSKTTIYWGCFRWSLCFPSG